MIDPLRRSTVVAVLSMAWFCWATSAEDARKDDPKLKLS
jgi:hypothetical protein